MIHTELNIPVGVSDFAEIRGGNYYYVDKTGLIRELLKTSTVKVTLFTRPRRFGKSLAMSMLANFFDIRKDSRKIFEGLEISDEKELCGKWMNRWPTVFLSFKDVDGMNFNNAYEMLEALTAQIYKEHVYLLDSDAVGGYDKEIFDRIAGKRASLEEIKNSLLLLTQLLQKHYGRQAILLLDEYDVPMAKASANGYYAEMLEVMRAMVGAAFKDNTALRMAVITGCLRLARESIFTGANNFTADTISDVRYHEYFGFTEREVRKMAQDTGCIGQLDRMRLWYDGYRFGGVDVYCPWDVLNYIQKVRYSESTEPENFWENTSDNAVLKAFLDRKEFAVSEKFEILLNGGYIKETITETLTYDMLSSSEENLWSLLYLTGYLTKARQEELKAGETLERGQAALRIPNMEVRDIFRKNVVEWFQEKAVRSDRSELFCALWEGDAERLSELLSDLLFDTISYHDYAESYYHAFLTGLFSSAGYTVESNYENGLGRSDLVIKERSRRRAAVIETKIVKSGEKLEEGCRTALRQISEKQYARKLERSGFKSVIRYGIAFYQKECLVAAETAGKSGE